MSSNALKYNVWDWSQLDETQKEQAQSIIATRYRIVSSNPPEDDSTIRRLVMMHSRHDGAQPVAIVCFSTRGSRPELLQIASDASKNQTAKKALKIPVSVELALHVRDALGSDSLPLFAACTPRGQKLLRVLKRKFGMNHSPVILPEGNASWYHPNAVREFFIDFHSSKQPCRSEAHWRITK